MGCFVKSCSRHIERCRTAKLQHGSEKQRLAAMGVHRNDEKELQEVRGSVSICCV